MDLLQAATSSKTMGAQAVTRTVSSILRPNNMQRRYYADQF